MADLEFDTDPLNSLGNTGGPGLPTTIYYKEQSFEEVAEKEAYQAFFGATGGIGGIPENIQDATEEGKTTTDMLVVLEEKVEKETDLGRLVVNTKNAHSQYINVEGKANIACASHGYIAGKWLGKTRKVFCEENKGWIKFANETFPEISKSSREKYINVASVPSAEKYFKLGIDRLSELGSYRNSLSSDQRKNLGTDPISELAEGKVDLNKPIANNMVALNALTVNSKLEKNGIYASWDVLLSFYEGGLTIISEDTKHLTSIVKANKDKDKDNVNTVAIDAYLQALIDNNGDRSALLSDVKPDAKQLNTKIKSIDRQVLQLTESITKVLADKEVKGGIDTSILDDLIKKLSDLKEKFI